MNDLIHICLGVMASGLCPLGGVEVLVVVVCGVAFPRAVPSLCCASPTAWREGTSCRNQPALWSLGGPLQPPGRAASCPGPWLLCHLQLQPRPGSCGLQASHTAPLRERQRDSCPLCFKGEETASRVYPRPPPWGAVSLYSSYQEPTSEDGGFCSKNGRAGN